MARAALSHRADAQPEPGSWLPLPSLFGLAPCGVYPASTVTVGAVRSYRTFSPLPERGRPNGLPGRPPKRVGSGGIFSVALAVHGPLRVRVPDVIRHTALWSSDFPPPEAVAFARLAPGSDRPVLLPAFSLS